MCLKSCCRALCNCARRFIVAHLHGQCIELLEGDAGLEEARGVGELLTPAFAVGGHHPFIAIEFPLFALASTMISGKKQGRWKLR